MPKKMPAKKQRKRRRVKEYGPEPFLDAIPGSGGIIATIASRVGCDWNTAKKAIDKFPEVRAAYEAELETVNDLAESTLIKAIRDGDVASAKWWLTKKRRSVFGDSVDITTGGKPIVLPEPPPVEDVLRSIEGTPLVELFAAAVSGHLVVSDADAERNPGNAAE